MDQFLTQFGYRMIETSAMVIPEEVDRDWKERLFTWPWRPFRKTRTIYVPDPQVLVDNNRRMIVGHPVVIDQLKREVEDASNKRLPI